MEAVEKSNIPKILAKRLNGTMTFVQFSQIFVEVMDENIKLLYIKNTKKKPLI